MSESIVALRKRLAEIGHFRRAAAVLEWDLQCYLPPAGERARSDQLGALAELTHQMTAADETRRLIEAAEADTSSQDADCDDARLVANARRDFERTAKLPTELAAEVARHAAVAQHVWAEARSRSDFAAFLPYLEKTVELSTRIAGHLGYETDPYDALLDLFEPGMKTAEVAAMFSALKVELVELTQAIVGSRAFGQTPRLPPGYPTTIQSEVTQELVAAIGYDFRRGRQDPAPHPFCTSFSRDDVRITTRYDEACLTMALYASMHEAGHALYEQGIPEEFDNTPLGDGASMGVHESQSRLWENLVGRSRAFCSHILPKLQRAFPVLESVGLEQFYRSVNRSEPSFIRVEADEVTYNLHVLLRFEMERDMLTGQLKPAEAPEVWNAKMREYLGITPPDAARGILQDVHWSAGMLGYFPTYTLGNVLSGQLWRCIRKEIPDLDAQIAAGEFSALLAWLRERIHRHGRKYLPAELVVRATGEPLKPSYYIEYLKGKYGELYGLAK